MKYKLITTVAIFSFGCCVLIMHPGCKKDSQDSNALGAGNTEAVVENARVDAAFDDVASISDEAAEGALESYRLQSNEKVFTTCAIISIDSVSVPKRITVDFGTTDCLCKDGNYRRGKIYIDFMGAYRDSGSTHSISFNNYFVNSNQLLGTKTVHNNGRNGNGYLHYTVSVNGSVVWDSTYGGGTSSISSSRIRTWVQGENTLSWLDDVYLISGSSTGTTRTGTSYTLQITTPLKKEIGFRHFTEGVLDFTPGNLPVRSIDFSYLNGARDNLARVTISGTTVTVQLH